MTKLILPGTVGIIASSAGGGVPRTWSQVGSMPMQMIYALASDGSDLYCCGRDNSSDGHVYHYNSVSDDWDSAGVPNGSLTIARSLAFNSGTLYVGMGSNDSYVYSYAGGTSWTSCGDLGQTYVQSLTSHGGDLIAGLSNGFVWKFNSGVSWTSLGRPSGTITWINVAGHSDGELYAAGQNENDVLVYDTGTSWDVSGAYAGTHALQLKSLNSELYLAAWSASKGNAKIYSHGDPNWSVVGNGDNSASFYSCGYFDGKSWGGGYSDLWACRDDQNEGGGTYTDVEDFSGSVHTIIYDFVEHDGDFYAALGENAANYGQVWRYS